MFKSQFFKAIPTIVLDNTYNDVICIINMCNKHNILTIYKPSKYFRVNLHSTQMSHQKQRKTQAPWIMKNQKQTQ